MNNFHFAIASIVDANTGHGLLHNNDRIDYAAAAKHGRKIRSRSIAALFGEVKSRLLTAIASIRDHRVQRRNLHHLTRLNDHILEDIGISRDDVIALQMGQLDLPQLELRRAETRSTKSPQPTAITRSVGKTIPGNAINEAIFTNAKCA